MFSAIFVDRPRLAIVIAIVCVNFLLIHAAPGDPASVLAGQSGSADPEFIAQLRHQFGLDQPLYVQLWLYVSSMLRGDLGDSLRNQQPAPKQLDPKTKQPDYSYAHPMFWAPYALVGDGGAH